MHFASLVSADPSPNGGKVILSVLASTVLIKLNTYLLTEWLPHDSLQLRIRSTSAELCAMEAKLVISLPFLQLRLARKSAQKRVSGNII